jgi:hypothetical protein
VCLTRAVWTMEVHGIIACGRQSFVCGVCEKVRWSFESCSYANNNNCATLLKMLDRCHALVVSQSSGDCVVRQLNMNLNTGFIFDMANHRA